MILKKNIKLMESMKMHILLRSNQMARQLQEQLILRKHLQKVDIQLRLAIGMEIMHQSPQHLMLIQKQCRQNIMKMTKIRLW